MEFRGPPQGRMRLASASCPRPTLLRLLLRVANLLLASPHRLCRAHRTDQRPASQFCRPLLCSPGTAPRLTFLLCTSTLCATNPTHAEVLAARSLSTNCLTTQEWLEWHHPA